MADPIKIIVAPQAFKGTASAAVVADAMVRAISRVLPQARIIRAPIADGGGGTVEALVTATNGHYINSPTIDPLGRPIEAKWGVLGDKKTAVIETSAASGLSLLDPSDYNPEITTTKGTGLLIKAALDLGYKDILIGLGDSATNDAGVGLAHALGIKPLDVNGNELPNGGSALVNLHSFDVNETHPLLNKTTKTVLCDVKNPLCGMNGASIIFGPQKGASPQQIHVLDTALANFASVVQKQFNKNVLTIPGAGAGGGLGAGLVGLCNATLQSGFEVISQSISLKENLNGADIVLTGEGRIDSQTPGGKGVAGIANMSRQSGVKSVAVIVGSSDLVASKASAIGFDAVFPITNSPKSEIPTPEETPRLIENATIKAIKTLMKGK